MKKTITLILCVVLIMTLFAGCSKKEASIIGTWQAEEYRDTIIEFDTDGVCYLSPDGGENSMYLTYSFDGKNITMERIYLGGSETMVWEVKHITKDTLVFSHDGVTVVMNRVNYSIK